MPGAPQTKQVAGWSTARVVLLVSALVAPVLLLGTGIIVFATVKWLNREDTPARYVQLSKSISKRLYREGEVPETLSEAEVLVEIKAREASDRELADSCRALANPSREDLAIMGELRRLAAQQPGFANIAGSAAFTTLGVATHNGDITKSGGSSTLDEWKKLTAFASAVQNLKTRSVANSIELTTLAPQFSGPEAHACFVTGGFRESWPEGDAQVDTLMLRNMSGGDLHDCTVYVRVKGDDGNTFSSVRFGELWPKDEVRCVYLDSFPYRETAHKVQSVFAQVWGREASSPPLTMTRPAAGW